MSMLDTYETECVATLLCVIMECWHGEAWLWTQSADDYTRFDLFPAEEEQ